MHLNDGNCVSGNFEIRNIHRAVGAMLSGEIAKSMAMKGFQMIL